MRALPRPLGRYSPPPAVLGLLALEFVVTGFLLALGVPWPSLLVSAGPVIALTLALLNPTVQELGRRQPKLSVTTSDGHSRVVAPSARPWPIDPARVVSNEVSDAQETAKMRYSSLDNLAMGGPFAIRPSQADHEESQEKFTTEVQDFEQALRGWLAEYNEAARACANTFEIQIAVRNAASGAHAEAVTVVLDLPATVAVVADRPTLPAPPERPSYQPPRPRALASDLIYRHSQLPDFSVRQPAEIPLSLRNPTWSGIEDGERLEAAAGDIHPDRQVNVGEPLFFCAAGPGQHAIGWTAYTKSARKSATGTIVLEVPTDSAQPAFGRLHGIISYPDVPLIDDDGEVIHPVRDCDPPVRPESGQGDGPVAMLREANSRARWRLLGLDPSDDGPERVDVRKAEPATSSASDARQGAEESEGT
jgi:hypothetical protein